MYKPESIRGSGRDSWTSRLPAAMPGLCAALRQVCEVHRQRARGRAQEERQLPPAHPFFTACDALMTRGHGAGRRICDGRLLQLRLDLVRLRARASSAGARRRRTRSSSTISCTACATRWRARRGRPLAGADSRPLPAALIDEFQDTDPVQYQIFRRVYHGRRGAALPDRRSEAGDLRLPRRRRVRLHRGQGARRRRGAGTSTRSTPTGAPDPRLLDAVNAALRRRQAPFVFDEIPLHADAAAAPAAPTRLGGSAAGRAPLQILFVRGPAGAAQHQQGVGRR